MKEIREYHICYFIEDKLLSGKNYYAKTMIQALMDFTMEHNSVEKIKYIVDKSILGIKEK